MRPNMRSPCGTSMKNVEQQQRKAEQMLMGQIKDWRTKLKIMYKNRDDPEGVLVEHIECPRKMEVRADVIQKRKAHLRGNSEVAPE